MIHTLRRKLLFYQRQMADAKSKGDDVAHELYRKLTRDLSDSIQEKEKAVCSQQTAQNQTKYTRPQFNGQLIGGQV